MPQPVSLAQQDHVALIAIDNPPVNALSHAVRSGLQNCLRQAIEDDEIQAIVIYGEGRSFIAGADIREFGQPPKVPHLPDLINEIEASPKPVVVACHGTALGGGLEVALGGHYRVAPPSAKFGLPEVSLGLLPGAGGTQRLPRLVSAQKALGMITSGKPITAQDAFENGLIDRITPEGPMREAGLAFARDVLEQRMPLRPTRNLGPDPGTESIFADTRAKLHKSARGQIAPQKAIDAVEASLTKSFDDGLKNERRLFLELMGGDQRAAMIHAFFAERKVGKLPELANVTPRCVADIGVIGGGTMGAGIAASAVMAGLNVTMIERDKAAAAKGHDTVRGILDGAVKRGKLSAEKRDAMMRDAFDAGSDYAALASADLVIEAVFESMDVKQDVFSRLDSVCKPGAILATNTSYLDINDIANLTSRPNDVIGLHFFSPAHVMRLLEVVVADKTDPDVTATGFALAKRLGKIAVRAGVCDGFIGNRILSHYRKALEGAVLAGASPYDVDRALVGFGLAMGPFAVGDLSGLDIAWANRKRHAATRDPRETYAQFADTLCEAGHFGRKTGRGYYDYSDGTPVPNPDLTAILEQERLAKGITARALDEQDIIDRYMAAMVNEAFKILDEGIALRPLDIDVTMLNGYGFPRWRGGPMHYAETVGLDKILSDIRSFAKEDSYLWQPAALLERLVTDKLCLASLNG
ncbi:3-hydroxyacyl-CoA dehydrogenase NAD-binding domain-containing protein [uncultured Pelagimonas sp.]|uniref:3-hydroxyacyl-CoA dehydrogenase NAD-binding domain-containing protein n=1 Tax=uncultured Pelagimonas sp. TaxID=1618102 RepID=UPI0026078778|nr:3-hydroxyacyl-CoA dehydrogenase NAD-binding domain-containing protein [uncultured Pelagimonas sp.]